MSEHIEDGFTGVNGNAVYWQAWLPAEAIGVVVISHGVSEHGGRYAHVAEALANAGYAAYAIDHHGHGKSAGHRANIDAMKTVSANLHVMFDVVAKRHPGLPLFLLGHSMGALISLHYLSGSPAALRGAVLSAPPVQISVGGALERKLAPVLSWLVPNLGVVPIQPDMVSRDPAVVQDYATDPLNFHKKIPARTGAEILATAEGMPARLGRISLPILLLQGTADVLVDPSSSTIVYRGISSGDKKLNEYPGLYHEVLNEPEKEQVIADVLEWLTART